MKRRSFRGEKSKSGDNSPITGKPKKRRKHAYVATGDQRLMIVNESSSINIGQDDFIAKKSSKCPTFHRLSYSRDNLMVSCTDVFSKKK